MKNAMQLKAIVKNIAKEKHNIDDSRSSISMPQDMNALRESGF